MKNKEEKKQSFGPQFKEFMHQSTEKSESYSFHKYGRGAKVDINANCKKSFLICKFTFSTQDFYSYITNFMVTW